MMILTLEYKDLADFISKSIWFGHEIYNDLDEWRDRYPACMTHLILTELDIKTIITMDDYGQVYNFHFVDEGDALVFQLRYL